LKHAKPLPEGQRSTRHDQEGLTGEEYTVDDGFFVTFLVRLLQVSLVTVDNLLMGSEGVDSSDRADRVLRQSTSL
jgi:hypothetical protein